MIQRTGSGVRCAFRVRGGQRFAARGRARVRLLAAGSVDVFQYAGEFRARPGARDIPVILYADRLEPEDIENAARVVCCGSRSGAVTF